MITFMDFMFLITLLEPETFLKAVFVIIILLPCKILDTTKISET